jgi:hypothetical protein
LRNYNALVSQFTGYKLSRLYIVTLGLGPGNVRGDLLEAAMRKLKRLFGDLCSSTAWRQVIERCGGPQHRPWKCSSKHGNGFQVHHQLICLARTKKPRWRRIAKVVRKMLGLPKSTPEDSYFYAAPLDTLEGHARYLCAVDQLVPGYDADELKEESEMMNIPDEDLVAFTKAVRYQQRIYFRGADPSRKPPRPEPKWRKKPSSRSKLSKRRKP